MYRALVTASLFSLILIASGCANTPKHKPYNYLPGYLENVAEMQKLDKELTEKESHSYAGMYISKSECYCLTALFKENGQIILAKYTNNPSIEPSPTSYSLNELNEIKSDTKRKLEFLGSGLDGVDISVRNNRVDVSIQGNTMTLNAAKKKISESKIQLHPIVRISAVFWDEI